MPKQLIKLGHSPDPDDAFMFFGLAQGSVDTEGFTFQHILKDIQTLNDWATQGKLEVTAISVHAYAYVQDKYAILSSGASMGASTLATYLSDQPSDNTAATQPDTSHPQGPLLISREPLSLDDLTDVEIAIPGTMTTAFLTLQLAIGKIRYRVMPFDEILQAVADGAVTAGLIIHEGQLTYQRQGLHCLLDLGLWWYQKTKLPLPLGCNVIRRDLGNDKMARISKILKKSIQFGLSNRREALQYALDFGQDLDTQLADTFISMYVNNWTIDYGDIGRKAIAKLLTQSHKAKLTPSVTNIQFI